MSQTSTMPAMAAGVRQEAARRRTFAVISHPDAGKSTITEALALHAKVIGQAGAVHGKAGRRGVVSDWMAMERARGVAAVGPMQFDVAAGRLEAEFNVPTTIDHLPYELARRTDQAGEQALQGQYGVEVLTRIRDGARLALFPNPWRLNTIKNDHPDLMLEPLLADTT